MLAAGLAIAAFGVAPAQAAGPAIVQAAETGEGRYIVLLHGQTPAAGRSPALAAARRRTAVALAAEHSGKAKVTNVFNTVLNGFAVSGMSEREALELAADPDVAEVREDNRVRLSAVQTDPPSGLDRIDQPSGRDGTFTYPDSVTGEGVHVYVVDTGIYPSHNDFGGRATADVSTIPAGHQTPGQNPTSPIDCHGHGTHIAGTIGGTRFGVAKKARLHGVRAMDCTGNGWESYVVAGIDWVTDNRQSPAVVNLSISFGGGSSSSLSLAVAASISSGIQYAVAAGNNDGKDVKDISPANVAEAVTVSSVNKPLPGVTTDPRSPWANLGRGVDIFAPGIDINSTWFTGPDATMVLAGTSMATPHVTGAMARYLQVNPQADPQTVASAVLDDAVRDVVTDPGPGPNRLLQVPPDPAPRGRLESANNRSVTGWADDRSCPGPIDVQIWADPPSSAPNRLVTTTRADRAHRTYGPHRFEADVQLEDGTVVTAVALGVDGKCAPSSTSAPLTGRLTAPSGAPRVPTGSEVYLPVGQRAGMTTGIQILNGSEAPADVDVLYKNENGSTEKTVPRTIPGRGAVTLVQEGPGRRPDGSEWSGAVRIVGKNGADDLSAVANHIVGTAVASSMGLSGGGSAKPAGSRAVNLPLLMRDHSGFTTWFALQNTGTTTASVSINYSPMVKPGEPLFSGMPVTDTIEPGASKIFSQASVELLDQSDKPYTLMSARIDSDVEVAATVFQQSADKLMEYRGLDAGDMADSLTLPLVMANNWGNFTGVQVTNAGNRKADITITYGPNTATTWDPRESDRLCKSPPDPKTVSGVMPGRQVTFLQRGLPTQDAGDDPQFARCTYIGAARITSTLRQPLNAVVNQTGTGLGSTYEARPTKALSEGVQLPLIQVHNYGTTGGIQIANDGAPTTARITFGRNIAIDPQEQGRPKPCTKPPREIPDIALGPLGTTTKLLPKDIVLSEPGCAYVGSVTVTAGTGARLAILANQINPSGTDTLATYAAP